MSKASPIQTSFNAGEFSPEMEGRVEVAKYQSACKRMENFIPLVQGPARRRGGTKYVTEVKTSANRTWLARFEFNTDQVYVLEFGNLYVRFYTDDAALLEATQAITNITQDNPGVLTYTGTDPANGDRMYLTGIGGMTELNGKFVLVANVNAGANTFELDELDGTNINTTGYTAYTAGGTMARVYTLTTPYTTANLINADGSFALQMVQSGDQLYICHPSYTPQVLSRVSASSWTIAAFDYDGGPFNDYDPDQTTTVYASATTGAGVTFTASASAFVSTDVGRLIYLEQKKINSITMWETAKVVAALSYRRSDGKTYYTVAGGTTGNVKPTHIAGSAYDGDAGVLWVYQDTGYGWAEITGYTSATVVTGTVLSAIPNQAVLVGNATSRWALSSWDSVSGFPSHVTFFRNRLVFARATDRSIWASVAGDYTDFRDRDDSGLVTDDMAVFITVDSDQSNQIQYIVPTSVLIIGTSNGEHILKEQTDSEPFGPNNSSIFKSSEYGSRHTAPTKIGNAVLFVQRSGRKLREIIYDSLQAGAASVDLSVMATHLVPKGIYIRQMAYQKEPHSILWCVLSDGSLRGFTYNREQYGEPPYGGWHRHTIGGSGLVESIVSVPSTNNDRDDLWMIVNRTINGSTVRYVERMMPEYEDGDDQEDCFYVDSGLTYDSTPTTTITGLRHLEGKTVDVLTDGATHPQVVVTSGAITLQVSASVVQVGLPCPCKLATLRMNAGAADGTAQGKTKRINRMAVRLLDTLGGYMGPTETGGDEIQFRTPAVLMGSPPSIFTGDKELSPWPAGYEKDCHVWYVNSQPLPATIVAIMPQVTTYDR